MNCSNIKKITDITDQINYKDIHTGGQDDSKWVSCGQDGNYNELKNKFDQYFNGIANEGWIAKLMCKCCKKLKPTGKEKVSWLEFYQCLLSQITDDTPNTAKKLRELIAYHKKHRV